MALNGTFYGTTANSNIKPRIVWSAKQNTIENYSDITATLSYSRTNNYASGTEGYWTGSLSIGANTKTASGVHLLITKDSNTVAITHTARVYHDSYGALSLTISAAGGITNPASSSLKDTQISKKETLNTIARASDIRADKGDIGASALVTVTRKNKAFTHSIAFSFGSLSGYLTESGQITSQEVKHSVTSLNFSLPESFYAQIPDDPSGVCYLTCRTYSGQTKIGEDTASFTVTAPREQCNPEVSGTVVDTNQATIALTGSPSILVSGLSVARCTIHAEARNGATISTVKIGGKTIQGFSSQEVETYTDIAGINTNNILFLAEDSRHYSATHTETVALVPYKLLTNNARVQRTDPTSGNAILTLEGTCWKGSFGEVDNTLTVEYQIDGEEPVTVAVDINDDDTYSMQIMLSKLEYTQSHSVAVTMRDAAMSVPKPLTVQKGIPVFDWGENDFQFHVPVEVPSLTVGGKSLETIIRTIIQGG